MKNKNRTLLTIAILIIATGAATYSYLSPQLTLKDIQAAAETRNSERLRELIDFDAVKTNLKDDLNIQFAQSVSGKLKDNPFAGFGALLASAFVEKIVDALVSPAGISAMISDGSVDKNTFDLSASDAARPNNGYEAFELLGNHCPADRHV